MARSNASLNELGQEVKFPTSGGADKFLDFIEKEVMPLVESKYRVQPYRVFAGHSFGGLLAIHAFSTRPELFNAYIAVGNYQAATQVALGTGEDDSTPAFNKLDDALGKGIEESRSQLRGDIVNAHRVLSGATVGAAVLSVVAALAVALGLWPRLSEYR